MRFFIDKGFTYFCCSTLPLLNGDIIEELNGGPFQGHIHDALTNILGLLEFQYSSKMPYRIKKEYKRMIRLYKYRLKMLLKGVY